MDFQTRVDNTAVNPSSTGDVEPQKETVEQFLEKLAELKNTTDLCNLVYDLSNSWIPFLQPQIWANKRYFRSQGGLKKMISFLNDPEMDSEVKREVLGSFRNFGETGDLLCMLLQDGLVNALIPLLRLPETQKHAIGLLFSLLEFDIKGVFASSYCSEVITILMGVCKKGIPKNTDYQRILSGCFCALSASNNMELNTSLFDKGVVDILLPEQEDTLTRYFGCIAIAYLLINPQNRWPKKKKTLALSKLSMFMKYYTPVEIREIEGHLGMVWTYLSPFSRMIDSQDTTILQFGVFCFTNLSYLAYNRKLIISEDLLAPVLCLKNLDVPANSAIKKYLSAFESNFQGEPSAPVPTLQQICKFAILQKCDKKNPKIKKQMKNWNLWEVEC